MIRLMLAFALALAAAGAWAHKPSDSYLALRVTGELVAGQWDIALRDLDFAIGLDSDGDDAITWGELKVRREAVFAYALARLELRSADGRCPLEPGELLVDRHTDGAYAVLRFAARCETTISELDARYLLLFDVDPQHKGLLRLEHGATTRTAIFSPDKPQQRFRMETPSRLQQFRDYFVEGVWHIWIGYDHILFLVSLLLPAVLLRERHAWRPVERFRPAFWDVFRIVTSFTVAHSITLSLAALGMISLPSRLVESAIAASVLLAALNNLYPAVGRGRWVVAFGFGLIHGFGFASVLGDLGLPRDALVLALVGFNLGVEAGQLAIVSAFLPAAYALRRTRFYRRVVLAGGSFAIAAIATAWLLERGLDIQLFPQ